MARPMHGACLLTGWRETPGTAPAVPPLLSLTSKAGAWPAHRPLHFWACPSCCSLASSTSLLQPFHHVLGHVFLAALGDQQCPREVHWEHFLIHAQAHPAISLSLGSILLQMWQAQQSCTGKFSPSAIPGPLGGKHGYFYPS